MICRVYYSSAMPTDVGLISYYRQAFRCIVHYQDVKLFRQIWKKLLLNNIAYTIFNVRGMEVMHLQGFEIPLSRCGLGLGGYSSLGNLFTLAYSP